MTPAATPRVPVVATVIWGVLLVLGLLLWGRAVPGWFRPPVVNGKETFGDYVQEWLSAKNHFAGASVYEDQFQALARHRPDLSVDRQMFLTYNAHPPASVLAALPSGLTDYHTAHTAWNLLTFAAFAAGILLVVRELAGAVRWWHAVPLLALCLWVEPVRANLIYGQISFVLGLLFAIGWVADRRGYPLVAGFAAGLAAGLKLFPGLLLVYFVCARKWKAAGAMVVAAVGLNAVAVAVLGVSAFETYTREVLPAVNFFQSSMLNASLHGFWNRFAYAPDLAPPSIAHGLGKSQLPVAAVAGWTAYTPYMVPPFGERPAVATAGLGVSLLAVAAVVGWAGWRSRKENDPDRGWAVGIAALTLASPIAWGHYAVMLVIPFAVAAARWRAVPARVLLGLIGLMMAVKDTIYPAVFFAERNKLLIQKDLRRVGDYPLYAAGELFTGVSWLTYANLALFGLVLFLPRADRVADSRSESAPTVGDGRPPERDPPPVTPPPSSAGAPAPSPSPGP